MTTPPTYQAIPPVTKIFIIGTNNSIQLAPIVSRKSNSDGAYTFSTLSSAITITDDVATINAYTSLPITITARQAASGVYRAGSTTFNIFLYQASTWTPQLEQSVTTDANGETRYGDVYFENTGGSRFNVYSLAYSTTFKLISGTYANIPPEITNRRNTLIGVIPLINITPVNNTRTPITFAFPSNNLSAEIVSFNQTYFVRPQGTGATAYNDNEYFSSSGTSQAANGVSLPYNNAIVINGVYDIANGGFTYGQNSILLRMEIRQAAHVASPTVDDDDEVSYTEKVIYVPITITKSISELTLKPFSGAGRYTIPGSDTNGIITREYLDGSIDLSFSQFATTEVTSSEGGTSITRITRKRLSDGTEDTSEIIYYLNPLGNDGTSRSFVYENDYFTITNNRITFRKVTPLRSDGTSSIPIYFLQEETAIYRRSTQRIGDNTLETIRLRIIKSTPTFVGQVPAVNTGDPTTVYRLADLNKMTTEGSFVLTPPISNNTDSSANFFFSSSNPSVVEIRVTGAGTGTGVGTAAGNVYMAYVYGSGTATIAVIQPATTNFNEKIAYFDVNVFEITPSVINCNTNLFYTNPYNRQFWTRFIPECRSSDLVDSVTGAKLSATQVDEVYDMRRKAEILKYNKNVGGLTKNQKYAKATRGELMRKIGNENKYLSQSVGTGGSAGFGPFTLICPPTSANSRVVCGLTSACGVPGKERLLCYDPSINLYNYKRTYEYKAGLQKPVNIPTTILSEPTNLRITSYDNENNKITLVWDAPESNGGFSITGYVITYSVDNKTWAPYKSVFPRTPSDDATYNRISGEINGNSVIFENIAGSTPIKANTVYYISVFSGNVRGLSSVPATITVKTSSVPSIISDFGFTTPLDERQNLMVDLKWTDPLNVGTTTGSYNGPQIRQYNLYYRKVPSTTWITNTIDISSVIIEPASSQSRRYILRNLANQSKYEIKIEPINSIGIGPESAIITARTLMAPSAPMNVILTSVYGLLPPIFTVTPGSYINVTWTKPDTGGNPITLYNVTVTIPPSPSTSLTATTITFPQKVVNVSSTNMQTTYSMNIGRLGQVALIPNVSYSIVVQAFNGYLTSPESTRASVTVLPTSAKATIFDIQGGYTTSGLQYAEMTFSIDTTWVDTNQISTVRVNGLNMAFQTNLNIYNQIINGTGEHKIRIPAKNSSGQGIIVIGQSYSITITLVFSLTREEQTSESFLYTPEVRYLTL
jgi:hypothetical protein